MDDVTPVGKPQLGTVAFATFNHVKRRNLGLGHGPCIEQQLSTQFMPCTHGIGSRAHEQMPAEIDQPNVASKAVYAPLRLFE